MTTTPQLAVLLDSGPLGLVTHPRANAEAQACQAWLQGMLRAGHRVLVPEICYYEVRRSLRLDELKKGTVSQGLRNLEAFAAGAGIVPITSACIIEATELWAQARQQRRQGAPDLALDADMILCAQARTLKPEEWDAAGAGVVIATGNLRHIEHFADARQWQDAWD